MQIRLDQIRKKRFRKPNRNNILNSNNIHYLYISHVVSKRKYSIFLNGKHGCNNSLCDAYISDFEHIDISYTKYMVGNQCFVCKTSCVSRKNWLFAFPQKRKNHFQTELTY